ncbi:DUF1707 SHOCT-like domain-containing protein [Mycobacterium bourgelatii]|uniref:DUF1707 SHOCT-like domain-containing protein n=1 Tax=Mycobacterium bourgelatii TaxID=1273442 RepID=UPI0013D7380A|nr:DUF1707 domain-containing protein [Mycobacterium bourgelatii]
MARWPGTTSTRAKDRDREDACRILDNAFNDGEISTEEHRERVSAATRAVTLGELHDLVSDLQAAREQRPPTPTPTMTPVSTRRPKHTGRGLLIASYAVSVLLGVGIGWGLYGNTTSPLDFTSDPGAKRDGIAAVVVTAPKQLQSLGGLTGLLEQMRKRFGDTMGYRLVVYPDYASLDRPDPNEDRRYLSYTYRGGWGDPNSSAKSSSEYTEVDLSKFDVKAVVGIMRGAPETLGIKPADVKSSYLIIEPARDLTKPGTLSLTTYVSTDYGSGYVEFAGDGTIKQINYP